jgi:hypothetical protein
MQAMLCRSVQLEKPIKTVVKDNVHDPDVLHREAIPSR